MSEDNTGSSFGARNNREAEVERILQERRANEIITAKKAKKKKALTLLAIVSGIVALGAVLSYFFIIVPANTRKELDSQYQRGIDYYNAGNYAAALVQFQQMNGYKDSQGYIDKLEPHFNQRIAANKTSVTSSVAMFGLKETGEVLIAGHASYYPNVQSWKEVTAIDAGFSHVVGLTSSGTVLADGRNKDGECNVNGWTNIIQIAAGPYHTVGLTSDGRVYATGKNDHGECDVGSWSDVVYIAA